MNAANSGLLAGGGVCGVIFQRAGKRQLEAACQRLGHCPEGSAANEGPDFRQGAGSRSRSGDCVAVTVESMPAVE